MGLKSEDDVIDTSIGENENELTENPTGETPNDDDPAAHPPEDDADQVVVTIGEESPPAEEENVAPAWVKDLRKSNREQAKRLREQDQEISRLKGATAPQSVVVGVKPTLENCDYDSEKFERELEAFHTRKRQADDDQRKKEDESKTAQAAWDARMQSYEKGKTELKVSDFEDAEEAVRGLLSQTQQGIIVHGAKDSAVLIYALWKSPKKLQELAALKDPVQFAFAVSKLEDQVKVQSRKSIPVPERTVRGSAPVTGTVDSQLEKLRAEAERTGDSTKVVAYKRKLKANQK